MRQSKGRVVDYNVPDTRFSRRGGQLNPVNLLDATDPAFAEITMQIMNFRTRQGRAPTAAEIPALIETGRAIYARPVTDSVVYYMRLGNRVKIGFTTNVAARLAAYQAEEVMVTEPGGRREERQRHQQFAHLRVTGEWFKLEEPLTTWIKTLQSG